jgi:hypothetical protein
MVGRIRPDTPYPPIARSSRSIGNRRSAAKVVSGALILTSKNSSKTNGEQQRAKLETRGLEVGRQIHLHHRDLVQMDTRHHSQGYIRVRLSDKLVRDLVGLASPHHISCRATDQWYQAHLPAHIHSPQALQDHLECSLILPCILLAIHWAYRLRYLQAPLL